MLFAEKRKRLWCFMDIVTDHVTGKLRESAMWSNIFKGGVFWAYLKFVSATNYETMTMVAAGIIIGHDLANRGINLAVNKPITPTPGTVQTTSTTATTVVTP